jgi:trans-o-hydroxybenzylidenepyruvate hydratase-aldolase
MVTAADLGGVCAMMPAFATDDAGDVNARQTVSVDRLSRAVDRIIGDGVNMLATTGSFGESHTLLWSEYQDLVRATVETARHRVPVFIGLTLLNTREVIERARVIRDAGADGILASLPFYFPLSVDNAVQFYQDIADALAGFPVMIYHNPPIHRTRLPVEAFRAITTRSNIVAMKDSHRSVNEFCHLMTHTKGHMAVFVNQAQMYPYGFLGAAGCWSITAWMGPWPVLRLRDACRRGDEATAREICMAMTEGGSGEGGPDMRWRENSHKLAINAAGYCEAGPLRPPYRNVPPEVLARSQATARRWRDLCARYGAVEEATR